MIRLLSVVGLAWLYCTIGELQPIEYLKCVFLEILNVTTWSVFQNKVTYNTHRPIWTVLALTHLPCASGGSTGKYRTITSRHGPQRVHLISSWSRDLTCHSISVINYNTHRPVWTVLALTHLPCASGGSIGKYRTITSSHGAQRVHLISSWSRDLTCHSISVICDCILENRPCCHKY